LAVRASLEMLRVADARLTLPLWASVYRSVLGETRFSLFLLGTTGTRKSCLTALAQQHFGLGMSFDALPCSWEATANALEGIAFAAKDAVLAVDDFRPRGSSAEQARLQAAADRLFRSQANNAGRQRMRDDLSHRPPRPPRGLVVSSGEELPHGASCQARLLVLRVGAGSVNLDALTRSQEHAANGLFVQALAGFIRWLAPRYEVLAGALRSDADAMRVAFDLPGAHGRTPGAAADLQVAIRCFAKFAVEVGAITTVDADRLTESARATLREVVSEQIELLGSTDPVTRLLRLLVEAFAGGAAHVAGCNDRVPLRNKTSLGWRRADEGSETVRDNGRSMRDTSESWQAQGARVGWVDGEDLYLLPDATIAIVRRAVEATGEAWSTTERAMAEMLRERGLLRSHERARATQRVPRLVTSGRPRAWHLSVRSIGLTEDEIDGA
ncbi:MAG: DUF927 domain-containing protein, partial [Planctomycetota bacterium]|nr:DUF927 domain-containing protein [Planctomycetota bacterium]